MFRRALKALGGQGRPRASTLGGRNVLVPKKPAYPTHATQGGGTTAPGSGSARRVSAADRRRRNLTILAAFIIVTFFLGLIPALRFLLVLNLVADVLLIAYLGAALYFAAQPPSSGRADRREVSPRVEVSPPEVAGGGL